MKNSVGKITLKSGKKRTLSSKLWLERQLNDPYVKKAKVDGYRSRAAYKLLEIDAKFKIFKPNQKVIDLGAAPGGWSRVISEKVTAGGLVIAIDLRPIPPIAANVTAIEGDFEKETTRTAITTIAKKASAVVSDMAAPSCGIAAVDHIRIVSLLESAIAFSLACLEPGGSFVAKVLRGGTEGELLKTLKTRFAKVAHFKPDSSRRDSAETYVVAKGFKARDDVRPS